MLPHTLVFTIRNLSEHVSCGVAHHFNPGPLVPLGNLHNPTPGGTLSNQHTRTKLFSPPMYVFAFAGHFLRTEIRSLHHAGPRWPDTSLEV